MNLPVALQWTKLKDTEVRLLYDTRTNRIVFLIGNAAPQQKRSSQYSHPHLKGNKWQCDITPCLKGTTSMGVATWVWQILQYNECISCRVNKNAPQTSLSPFLVVTVILEDLSEWWRHPSSSIILHPCYKDDALDAFGCVQECVSLVARFRFTSQRKLHWIYKQIG